MENRHGRSLRVVDHPMPNGGWVATFEDITEQRQTEQERDRNREFLDQIIENVPVTIVVKDADTRKFVLANRAAEILWSFDRHDAIGKTPHDLFPKAQADIMTEHDNKVAARRRSDLLWRAPQPGRRRRRTRSHLEAALASAAMMGSRNISSPSSRT